MVSYRTFRNADPPKLRDLWNSHALQARSFGILPATDYLEQFLFAKPYFDPEGLAVALDGPQVVGFGHAGFGCDEAERRLDTTRGVVTALVVDPRRRREGIGTALLGMLQQYLTGRGSREQFAGPIHPFNPFGLGLYGGSETPGLLASDQSATGFFAARGYRPTETAVVYQLLLDRELSRVADPRLPLLRRTVRIFNETLPVAPTWWQACVTGPVMSYRYEMLEATGDAVIAHATLWEMETFGFRDRVRGFGILDFVVRPEQRRRGYAKLMLHSILKHLQDHKIGRVEVQTMEGNLAARGLYEGLGFAEVDRGHLYKLAGLASPTPAAVQGRPQRLRARAALGPADTTPHGRATAALHAALRRRGR